MINTWADGYGNWRAEVPRTEVRSRDASLAKAAILKELRERYQNISTERVGVHYLETIKVNGVIKDVYGEVAV